MARPGRDRIDRKNDRVLRIEFQATNIPSDFRVRAYKSTIDYDWVDIAGERVLLPITSDPAVNPNEPSPARVHPKS